MTGETNGGQTVFKLDDKQTGGLQTQGTPSTGSLRTRTPAADKEKMQDTARGRSSIPAPSPLPTRRRLPSLPRRPASSPGSGHP